MKNKLVYLLFLIQIIGLGLLVNSCEVTDPVEGLEVRLNTFSRETQVSSYIYDANTLQTVPENVQITFTGDDALLIVDETNKPKTTFSTKNGIFTFGIKDGTEISSSNPIKVSVTLTAPGYEEITTAVRIQKTGNQTKNLFMVSPLTLPQNSDNETFSNGTTNNSGTLQQNVQHTTAQGTSVAISGGTTITNTSGTPLTGNLTMRVTVIPLTSDNLYNVPRNIITSSNELINPLMKFNFSIIDAAGNIASNFSDNASFALNISDDLSVPYTDGDAISVWKENSTTGLWEKVGEAAFSSSASKEIIISSGSLNGTTSDAGNLVLGTTSQTCNATVNITNLPTDFSSTLQFFDTEGTLIETTASSTFDLDISDSGLQIGSVRINADLNSPLTTGIELGSNYTITCGTNNIELDFSAELMSIRCEIIGICTAKDPAVVVNPNISFSYKASGSSTWQSNTLVNGVAVVSGLEVGTTYEITATYSDQTGNAVFELISPELIEILEVSNPGNLLSSGVNSSTTPPTVFMEIDIENECD